MKLKIREKLFIAMLIANIIIIAGLFLLINWSFGSNFRQYLDANKEQNLAPLVTAITNKYRQEGDWLWLHPPRNFIWHELIQKYVRKSEGRGRHLGLGPRRQDNTSRPRQHQRPENGFDPFATGPQVFLFDRNKNPIIGRNFENKSVNWIEIKLDGSVIGFVGYKRTIEITSEMDQVFISNIKHNLIWSILFVIFVSALISLTLAGRFVRPLQKLRSATKSIISGNYNTKIVVESEDEIGLLSKDFNRLAETLDKNLAARQKWIADISHELRTPVAILQGELEALQDGVRTINSDSINSLHQEIIRLSKLIDDLHHLSLSDSGALSYKFEKVSLSAIISNVLEIESSLIEQCDFRIEHKKATEKIVLLGDSDRLTQLFINLLNNSLSYSNPGGLLRISYQVDREQVVIYWSDSEPGVSDEQLILLFDRLYLAETSRNRNLGGSGLGLSICRNIVEAHQGQITANHSSLGGVEFVITLPIEKEH
ncbi:MAG: ATP-binding protein [Kangiellaceae bacterium]|nr:ATP-binding protein [Kangiellaceae bacterium]